MRPAEFHTFDASHQAALAIFLIGCIVVLFAAGRLRGTSHAEVVSRVAAVVIVVLTVPMQVAQLLPNEWDIQKSLPLQLCDFAWIFAAHALWTKSRLTTTVTWLWGSTLTLQAVITPNLQTPFPELRFIVFWSMHMLIIWAGFWLVGLGFRPDWTGYRGAVAITLAWAASMFVFNTIVGTNYGYLNRKPDTTSILDILGPWPLYVVVEIVLILLVWAMLTAPFARRAR